MKPGNVTPPDLFFLKIALGFWEDSEIEKAWICLLLTTHRIYIYRRQWWQQGLMAQPAGCALWTPRQPAERILNITVKRQLSIFSSRELFSGSTDKRYVHISSLLNVLMLLLAMLSNSLCDELYLGFGIFIPMNQFAPWQWFLVRKSPGKRINVCCPVFYLFPETRWFWGLKCICLQGGSEVLLIEWRQWVGGAGLCVRTVTKYEWRCSYRSRTVVMNSEALQWLQVSLLWVLGS